ncbi:MAG: sulfatase-like hydrolase/transferase, partial [Spirochaetia bacterium]|nr:sulfatase-like hydrolase/transferase [Spirochaetia bacterium]
NNRENPFFLFLHTYRPHMPYRAPKDLTEKLLENYNGVFRDAARRGAEMTHPEALKPSELQIRYANDLKYQRARTREDREFLRKLYDAGVTDADREVGAVFDLLKKLGVYDRVLIVVTSDHGEEFFEHGLDSHYTAYDECIRVPLIVRMPGGEGAGVTIEETFSSVHLTPTILQLANVLIDIPFEGHPYGREILSGSLDREYDAFASWSFIPGRQFPTGQVVRSRTQKFIKMDHLDEGPDWLKKVGDKLFFDLRADPKERKNIYPLDPKRAAGLEELLKTQAAEWEMYKNRFGSGLTAPEDLSESALRDLEAVGYVR